MRLFFLYTRAGFSAAPELHAVFRLEESARLYVRNSWKVYHYNGVDLELNEVEMVGSEVTIARYLTLTEEMR